MQNSRHLRRVLKKPFPRKLWVKNCHEICQKRQFIWRHKLQATEATRAINMRPQRTRRRSRRVLHDLIWLGPTATFLTTSRSFSYLSPTSNRRHPSSSGCVVRHRIARIRGSDRSPVSQRKLPYSNFLKTNSQRTERRERRTGVLPLVELRLAL